MDSNHGFGWWKLVKFEYPNVPSIGAIEWWVHWDGSHFASPKSDICGISNIKTTSNWMHFETHFTKFHINIVLDQEKAQERNHDSKWVPVAQNLESIKYL